MTGGTARRLLVVGVLAVAAVGCASSPSSSAADALPATPTVTPSPTPTRPVTLAVDAPLSLTETRTNGASASYSVTAGAPIATVPFTFGQAGPQLMVGVPIRVTVTSGSLYVAMLDWHIGPTGDGTARDDYEDTPWETGLTSEGDVAAAQACGGQLLLNSHMADLTQPQTAVGQVITGCLAFNFTGAPTHISYGDSLPRLGTWPLALPSAAAAAPAKVLLSRSGSSSQLITVPDLGGAEQVAVCWQMTGNGNNVIEAETDSSGSNLALLTNAVGPVSDCKKDYHLNAKYLQVLANGPWTLTIKSY